METALCAALVGLPLPAPLPAPLQLVRPQKGEVILHAGSDVESFFILLEGICAARIFSEEGAAAVAATQSDRQVYGFSERMNNIPCHATVYAVSGDCRLLACPAELFLRTMKRSLPLALLMVQYLSGSAVGSMYSSASRLFRSPKMRLAEFCYAAALGRPLPFVLSLSREELAAQLHLNLRTLYRYLRALQRDGCLDTLRGKTCITEQNLQRLERLIAAQHRPVSTEEQP